MLEKCLDLIEHPLRALPDAVDIGVQVSDDPGGDQSVIANAAPIDFSLVCFDHAEQANVQHSPDRSRFVDEQQDVERIAILGARRANEAEIERKRASERQDAL